MFVVYNSAINFNFKNMDQGKKSIVAIVITAIVVAILAGGGVYMWQKSELRKPNLSFNSKSLICKGRFIICNKTILSWTKKL